jgi:hypothetical protein
VRSEGHTTIFVIKMLSVNIQEAELRNANTNFLFRYLECEPAFSSLAWA